MYKSIDLKEKASDFEKKVAEYWQDKQIPDKSITNREGAQKFVFFEGPPTANGKPGIHHVIARSIKDTVCRYKTMRGYQVKRKAGWDTHGLPVEIEVEKKLGLHNKKEVEEYGIEKFCVACRESVFSYEKEWQNMTKTMGYWIDLKNPYITLDNNYIESVWWILRQFFDKNLIYKGHKIVPYCPSCGTPLSSHEVAQGYEDVEDTSVFVKFKLIDNENTYFLAWTTTPWTLISNVALVVNPDEKYVKVRLVKEEKEEFLILAKARLAVLDDEYEIVQEMPGIDLEYQKYEPLFTYVTPDKPAYYVACGDYVSMEDGTGIVHTAPAFGQDDYMIGMKYNLPFIQPVDDAGKFTEEVTDYKGLFVKEADKSIIRALKDSGHLYKRSQIIHSYPFCWRCKSPLIYYARSTWYIRTSEYKNQMIHNNQQVNWYPQFVGEKRFGEWLDNNVDWALSRDRFWGTPLNIWKCEDCNEMVSIGSIEELRQRGKMEDGSDVPENIELHRPFIDKIKIPCPKCQKDTYRTPEVIDCWFDSGSMPFAQWHYPFENKDIFESELFPADFISEGIDQTRGWFYTLLAISTILRGESPYKNVLVNDLILDKNGQKMSKTRGNSVDPMEIMDKYGADAVRWYLLHVSPPWTPTKFDVKGVEEIYGKFIGTLKNVYSFYVTYASIDNFHPKDHADHTQRESELDHWIYSKLNSLIATVVDNNEKYDFTRSLRAIQKFVLDDLSNWYVRRSRHRYWAMELTNDKIEAYLTLFEVMISLSKLIAPFAPYIADAIYTGLRSAEGLDNLSVHLEEYPVCDQSKINTKLEKEMDLVVDFVTMGRAARNQVQIKVRQTLSALYLPKKHTELVQRMRDLIIEEINVKELLFLDEDNDVVKWQAKLNFKTAGPKYGKDVQIISKALENIAVNEILSAFEGNKPYILKLNDQEYEIASEDLMISIAPVQGFAFENNRQNYVALDVNMTPELILEGHAREVVNKIQFTRKEMKFEIMDRIRVHYFCPEEVCNALKIYQDYIKSETLSNEILRTDNITEDMKEWDINGHKFFLKIEKM
ncbi:MAG TPA: isoleucine--tRNA ligase [Candidatus Cloacimonadota bacterium]|nr:isoleucine--tRNA ligase [Candidatus Cloacimonadota bacterium]